jgi:hypothetical protein
VGSPDVLVAPEDEHLKISFIREIQRFIATSPVKSSLKTIYIPRAFRLTQVAQNAFLKTLEESPDYVQIYLYLSHLDQLISTVVSRCQVHYQVSPFILPAPVNASPLVAELNQSSLSHRVTLADNAAKTREQAIDVCHQLIDSLRRMQFTHPDALTAHRLKLLAEADLHLKGNANPHLTLEHVFIHWPLPNTH